MESIFPENKNEEQHLSIAFHQLEKERVGKLLEKHGIKRHAKIIRFEFKSVIQKWRIAAVIAFVCISSYLLYLNIYSYSSQQLADNAIAEIGNEYNFTVRSGNSDIELMNAQAAINKENWNLAQLHLEKALAENSAADSAFITSLYFFKGIIYIKQTNYELAIVDLSIVCNYKKSNLKNDATWLRGMAHLKSGNINSATIDLKSVSSIKGWKKAEEAKKILQAIQKENK
jgi:hypothetical protein